MLKSFIGKLRFLVKYMFFTMYIPMGILLVSTYANNIQAEHYKGYVTTTGDVLKKERFSRGKGGTDYYCTFTYTVNNKKWISRRSCGYSHYKGGDITVYYNERLPGNDPIVNIRENEDIRIYGLIFGVYSVLMMVSLYFVIRSLGKE
jgi:hypothetical protein